MRIFAECNNDLRAVLEIHCSRVNVRKCGMFVRLSARREIYAQSDVSLLPHNYLVAQETDREVGQVIVDSVYSIFGSGVNGGLHPSMS